ncbi:threonylcarbamoyl-AMP synthase [Alishewanella longhuensis]|uniref:Threonylcarbamoyl-AMP synthase n=1 Tax=Alishewanella longhuensis TaxID=1091037 RepID=A0ABQ3KTX8_9ALTE|nr:L-threonylcarbamoyladenylate synthase [Alishewanella longhuensis]GHG60403.1 threonylcarbamoyl-AMP synthase [Alishewanella longhuensis]
MSETLLLDANLTAEVELAAQFLLQGKLVAVPTETVYGLAADASQPEAVRQIFAAKGRPADHPLIVHLGDVTAMSAWAKNIPPLAYKLAAAFWPGPLTLLLPKADHVSAVVTGGLDSIGLRVPAHPVLLKLLQQHQLAVAAPSANRYKKLSPTSAQQVLHGLSGRIDAVLDGGDCQFGLESTIVSLLDDRVEILRAGPISKADLEEMLGVAVSHPKAHQIKVAGNVKAHYQPNTPLRCLSYTELVQHLKNQQTAKIVVLHMQDLPTELSWFAHTKMPATAQEYGQRLYRELFAADQSGAELILLEMPPQKAEWAAVQERLARAAH